MQEKPNNNYEYAPKNSENKNNYQSIYSNMYSYSNQLFSYRPLIQSISSNNTQNNTPANSIIESLQNTIFNVENPFDKQLSKQKLDTFIVLINYIVW